MVQPTTAAAESQQRKKQKVLLEVSSTTGGVVEVECGEVIRCVEQFLVEQGLLESAAALVQESGIGLRSGFKDDLGASVLAGKWETVLNALKFVELESSLAMDLVEQIFLELLDNGERSIARALLESRGKTFRSEFSDRFDQLENLVVVPQTFDKEAGRKRLSEALDRSLRGGDARVSPSRLEALIGQALRWQSHVGTKGNVVWGADDFSKRGEKAVRKRYGAISASGVRCATFVGAEDLATGSLDGFVEIWKIDTCRLNKTLAYQAKDELLMHDSSVLCLTSSADAETLASADAAYIKVWRIRTGACLRKFATPNNACTLLLFSDNDELVYGAGCDGTVRLYGLASGAQLRRFGSGDLPYVSALSLSADSSFVVAAAATKQLRVYEQRTADCLATLETPAQVIAVLNIPSSNRSFVVVYSSPPQAHLVDLVNAAGYPDSSPEPTHVFASRDTPTKESVLDNDDDTKPPKQFVAASLSKPHGHILYCLADNLQLFVFDMRKKNLEKIINLREKGSSGEAAFAGLAGHCARNTLAAFFQDNVVLYK